MAFAKSVYIVDWILFALSTIVLIPWSISNTIVFSNGFPYPTEYVPMRLMWTITSISTVVQLVLNLLLTIGVTSKSHCSCQIWFILHLLLMILGVFFGLLYADILLMYFLIYVAYLPYRIFTLIVIEHFMSELNCGSRIQSEVQSSTDFDYKNFA